MSVLLILTFVSCAATFEWGRRHYFRRVPTTTTARGGLAFLGPVFVLVNFSLLVYGAHEVVIGFRLLGLPVLLLALMIFLWAVSSHRDERPAIAFSSEIPRRLTLDGPYRWVRHPIYLAYSLFWLAPVLIVPGYLPVVFFCVMVSIYASAARTEENGILQSPLAKDYCRYRKMAGAFLPKTFGGYRDLDDR